MARSRHVLVVEDDAAIVGLLDDVLRSEGYPVSVASSGVEVLAQMRRDTPDLVLLDLMLPDMNGWTLLQVRERERDISAIPVLVISAAARDRIQGRAGAWSARGPGQAV